MEFGPTDRFDVIELKGFEEHEIKREGTERVTLSWMHSSGFFSFPLGLKDSVSEQDDNSYPPITPESRGEEPEQQPIQKDEKNPDISKKQAEEDNEFILDGFDFSTSVSICQALDLDEDGSDSQEGVATVPSTSTRKPAKDPAELGNALLKALGVGKEEKLEVKTPPRVYTNSTGNTCTGNTCVL